MPIGGKCIIKVPFAKQQDCKLLLRAHGWELVSAKDHADVPVKVQSGTPDDSLDLDLTQTKLPPGEYQLAALWDWDAPPGERRGRSAAAGRPQQGEDRPGIRGPPAGGRGRW